MRGDINTLRCQVKLLLVREQLECLLHKIRNLLCFRVQILDLFFRFSCHDTVNQKRGRANTPPLSGS